MKKTLLLALSFAATQAYGQAAFPPPPPPFHPP